MAQLRGHLKEIGNTQEFHPLEAAKLSDGSFVLKTLEVTGTPEHHNGDADLIAAPINFSGATKRVIIENKSGTQTLAVSFDGGSNFKTIAILSTLDVEVSVTSIDIKASADTTPYEILAIV